MGHIVDTTFVVKLQEILFQPFWLLLVNKHFKLCLQGIVKILHIAIPLFAGF